MPFDMSLADRVRRRLSGRSSLAERKMFGCIGFLLHGNVCVAVWRDSLVVRVGPETYPQALREPFVREFDITGRPMTGWVRVAADGVADDDQLDEWITRALAFVCTLPAKRRTPSPRMGAKRR